MFGTTSAYDYEASYQQTTLTGAVAGWFTIAETNTTCNYTNIATQAKQKASAAGYALSNYNRFVYVFPANACGWWGMGTVGGNPSQAWIHTKSGFSLRVVGHEMGHNFGLYHAHSLDCGTSAIAASGCTVFGLWRSVRHHGRAAAPISTRSRRSAWAGSTCRRVAADHHGTRARRHRYLFDRAARERRDGTPRAR